MLQELNLGLAAPFFPRELSTCPCRGANRVLETSLEFAVVLVCALNLSSASSAARPLAGRDGGDSLGRDRGLLEEGLCRNWPDRRRELPLHRDAVGSGVESRVACGMLCALE